jgi:hypothetical protein
MDGGQWAVDRRKKMGRWGDGEMGRWIQGMVMSDE